MWWQHLAHFCGPQTEVIFTTFMLQWKAIWINMYWQNLILLVRSKIQQNFSFHKSMLSRLKPLEEVGSQICRRIQSFYHHLKQLFFNGNQTKTLVDLGQPTFPVSCSSRISNPQRCSFQFAVPTLQSCLLEPFMKRETSNLPTPTKWCDLILDSFPLGHEA